MRTDDRWQDPAGRRLGRRAFAGQAALGVSVATAAGLLGISPARAPVSAQGEATPAASPAGSAAGPRPRRVIHFHIDSLLPDAPEELRLANWLDLAAQGTRVMEATTIFPYHPTDSGYFELSTTSFPNPTTAAGSLFLRPFVLQRYLQHSFDGYKAMIAGSTAYRSVAEGYSYTNLSADLTDEQVVGEGLRQLREHEDLTFMRLILQDANGALQDVGFTRDDLPWRNDAYGEGSPYVPIVRHADELLGRFVDELERAGKVDDTLLVLMPDGAARAGWHAPQQEESWRLPLAFVGPGVARQRTTGYAENIDVAPTVAALAGVEAPNRDGASGRVLTEIFANDPGQTPDLPRRILRLNQQIKEYLRLTGWMLVNAERYPLLDLSWMASHNSYLTDAQFWSLDRVDEWPQAGTIDDMIADNQQVLDYLNQALNDSGAGPIPR